MIRDNPVERPGRGLDVLGSGVQLVCEIPDSRRTRLVESRVVDKLVVPYDHVDAATLKPIEVNHVERPVAHPGREDQSFSRKNVGCHAAECLAKCACKE